MTARVYCRLTLSIYIDDDRGDGGGGDCDGKGDVFYVLLFSSTPFFLTPFLHHHTIMGMSLKLVI